MITKTRLIIEDFVGGELKVETSQEGGNDNHNMLTGSRKTKHPFSNLLGLI